MKRSKFPLFMPCFAVEIVVPIVFVTSANTVITASAVEIGVVL